MVDDSIQREYLASTPDRPRAILTERERRYYLGDDNVEPKSQAERSLRQNVRKRLTHALLDLSILATHLDQRDLDRVFRAEVTIEEFSDESIPSGYLDNTVADTITLLFRSRYDFTRFEDAELGEGRKFTAPRFERDVEDGVSRAALLEEYDARVEADIQIEPNERTLNELRERLEDEGVTALNARELEALRDAGEIGPVEYHELQIERHRAIGDEHQRLPPDDEE